MLKKYFLYFLLMAISCNIACSQNATFKDALEASKRGFVWAFAASTPCLFMDNSWMESIAAPFVAGGVGAVGSFIIENVKQNFLSRSHKIPLALEKTNINFFTNCATKIRCIINPTLQTYNNNYIDYAREMGMGFGIGIGIAMCTLCYTKTGLFNRN